jgi:hypothetical protein
MPRPPRSSATTRDRVRVEQHHHDKPSGQIAQIAVQPRARSPWLAHRPIAARKREADDLRVAVQPTNVVLRWTLLTESRRLDEWTTVALSDAAGVGFEFDHDGERWQVTRVGLAGEMGFTHAIAQAIALDCAPVYEPELEDSLSPVPVPAT